MASRCGRPRGGGQPIGIEDALIGATALVGSLTVATRNVRHFRWLRGLAFESWWPEDKRAQPEAGRRHL